MELEFDIDQTKSGTVDWLTDIKIIKTYYKNDDSATTTYRSLRGDYGVHNRPAMQAIGNIVKKFEEPAVLTNIERPVHHRFTCSIENIAILSASVALDLEDSSPLSEIRTILRHIMANLALRSTSISIKSPAQATT